MLEHLFGSKTRVRLLNLFIGEPDKAFFVRELTRVIDTQINAVRREIDNLVNMGLIVEKEVEDDDGVKRPGVKRKYYQINKMFPMLPEIQSLLTKSNFLIERRLDKEIAALGDVKYLAFMGSFLGQKASVDLFIVGDLDVDKFKILIDKAEKTLGFPINYTCLNSREYNFRKDIADKFLTDVMSAPKHVSIDTLERK